MIRIAALALALSFCLACHEERPDQPLPPAAPAQPQTPPQPTPAPSPPPAPAEKPTPPPATLATPPTAPAQEHASEEAPGCAVPVRSGQPTPVKIGDRNATLTGTALTFAGQDADGKLVLGVLGPINEDSGENILGLRRYESFFAKNHADAIVVTGDLGEVSDGIDRVVEELARTKLPVLVVIGNRECRGDFLDGVKRAQAKFSNVVNLNQVREVVFPGATLISLPGYHDPNYINCDTGCRYTKKNLDEVAELARAAQGPVVLVSHGPPHGEGSQAIDYAESAGNVGDPEINVAITRGHIAFGVFSNIKEAGGRATDLEGTTLIPQDTLVGSLYLNPGPAGVEGWRMNGGRTGHGFAAILTLQGDKAAWKLYTGKKLSPAEKKKARTLAPPPSEGAGL
jgi:Icc-related predicted phosphoesterase